jgi:hypothetical protein
MSLLLAGLCNYSRCHADLRGKEGEFFGSAGIRGVFHRLSCEAAKKGRID